MFKLKSSLSAFCLGLVLMAGVVTTAQAMLLQQMEVRSKELFDLEAFQKANPAVGTEAPELVLKTISGETVKLSSYRGKNVVVVKAAYT